MTIDQDLEKQLTRVYVALAMTRDAAERCVTDKPTDPTVGSLLTLLDVASDMLEEILDPPIASSATDAIGEVFELDAVM